MAKSERVTENQVAFAIVQIAKKMPGGIATFARCRKEIPDYLNLSAADRTQSKTRPNEEMWEQQIRNVKSHHAAPGNYICEGYLKHIPRVGYEVTNAGRQRQKP
jgi:hypothetical protein